MTERALVTRRADAQAPPTAVKVSGSGAEPNEEVAFGELSLSAERRLAGGTLVRSDASDAADRPWRELEARGYRVKRLPEGHIIQVGNFRLDIGVEGAEGPPVPPELSVPAGLENHWPHHLVQLIAPPTQEWIQRIEAEGVDVAEPISRYALFVCAPPDRVASLRGLKLPGDEPGEASFVAWTGPFQPAYRVAPELLRASGRLRYVNVGVYPEGRVEEVAESIAALGGRVMERWGREGAYRDRFAFLVAELDADRIPEVACLPWVRSLHPQAARMTAEDERSVQIVAPRLDGRPPPTTSPVRAYQDVLAALKLDGSGVVVGICDTGVDTNDAAAIAHSDLRGRVAFCRDVTGGERRGDLHGHGTHVAAIAVGDGASGVADADGWVLGQGVAPGARFGSVNPVEIGGAAPLKPFSEYTRIMVREGAHVMNNSWGMEPGAGYTAVAALLDRLVRDPNADDLSDPAFGYLVIVCSAGNRGSAAETITDPKEAKNVIVVGSSHNWRGNADIRGVAPKSSRGPAQDGRCLPTVVAPGFRVVSARTTVLSSDGIRPGSSFEDSDDPKLSLYPEYSIEEGTSMAAAHVAGLCALIIQWWGIRFPGRRPSPAMVKALLVNGAEDLAGGPDGHGGHLEPIPNNDQGWGRVCLSNIVAREPKILHDQDRPFEAAGEHVFRVRVDDPGRPLRITLAWTDPPKAEKSVPALANDLDLEVTEVATGRRYKGNVFRGGFSVPDQGFSDDLNNLECVYVEKPVPGSVYRVDVIAAVLTGNARPPFRAMDDPWQDYALVMDNAVEVGATG